MDAKGGGFEIFLQRLREQPSAPAADTGQLLRALRDAGPMPVAGLVSLLGIAVIESIGLLEKTGLVALEDHDSARFVKLTAEGEKVAGSAAVA